MSSNWWGAVLAGVVVLSSASARADVRIYNQDAEVPIWVNWDSFEAQGIPASWRDPFMSCLYNAIVKWRTIGAFRLKPAVYGYTTRTVASSGEIIVQMNEKHVDGSRVASTFGTGSAITIIFHRKSSNGTPWNFTPHRNTTGAIDMQGVAIHEFGHAFGLDHEDGITTAVMFPSVHAGMRHGPTTKDYTDVRALYGARDYDRVYMKRSTDNGVSWSAFPTNLSGIGVTTSIDPTALRDTSQTVFFYTGAGKNPQWIRGNADGSVYDTSKWFVFGGERSIYGTTGHGWNNDYIMAWVDPLNDAMQIRMVKSTDGGVSWFGVGNVAGATTIGTPAVHKLTDTVWILAYAKLDRANSNNDGQVVTRVSTNGGWNWGPEVAVPVPAYYRALAGVSITSSGNGFIRIGFSWSDDILHSAYRVRTMKLHWDGANLVYDGLLYGTDETRTQPSLAKSLSGMHQAVRGTNFAGVLYSRTSPNDGSEWGTAGPEIAPGSLVTPSVSAHRDYSFVFAHYLQ
ncbi:Matrixin [Myxococcus fulvus]|uniref:Matrixin n=1 Tax=Myxococcus fulvus TaxID=33 RepID=A0ABY1C2E5_MYXFU|nr:Matrixin [Myxococcus fulvus]